MGIFGVEKPIDQWAEWDQTVKATTSIQGICLAFSLGILLLRCYQAPREVRANNIKSTKRLYLLQASHLFALLFSCLYIFLHFWNYVHFFIDHNSMDCAVWFEFVMVCITLNKNFLYTFLMLRSSLAFNILMFRIPLPVTLVVILIAVVSQWVMTGFMVADYIAISPFPDNGFCFRLLGESGAFGLRYWNLADALSGMIALGIFAYKAWSVKTALLSLEEKGEMDAETQKMKALFDRHIMLGVLIIAGSIVLFFLAEFLSVTMGIVGTLQQAVTNFYIFLFFPKNVRLFCCRTGPASVEQNLSINIHESTNNSAMNPVPVPSQTGQSQTETGAGGAAELTVPKSRVQNSASGSKNTLHIH